jgi:hypothetical protein
MSTVEGTANPAADALPEAPVPRPSTRRSFERIRRRWLGPLFTSLGYDLLPATPEWLHRPLSNPEVERLLTKAATCLESDLAAAGIGAGLDLPKLVREFWHLIPTCPVRQRQGGNGFNGALQIFAVARALRPDVVIESGVFRGLTTWVLRQACPQARLFCFDPVLDDLRYRDPRAQYNMQDWSEHDFAELDLSNALAFFDDHISHARRTLEAHERGIRHVLFDDDAAAHRLHTHGGPAFPTIAMITSDRPASEPVRWLRNGREFVYAPDESLARAHARIAASHAFDDMHRATGYSPARLCYVRLKGMAEAM